MSEAILRQMPHPPWSAACGTDEIIICLFSQMNFINNLFNSKSIETTHTKIQFETCFKEPLPPYIWICRTTSNVCEKFNVSPICTTLKNNFAYPAEGTGVYLICRRIHCHLRDGDPVEEGSAFIVRYKLEKVKCTNWHSGGEDTQTIPAETLSLQSIWSIFTLQTVLIQSSSGQPVVALPVFRNDGTEEAQFSVAVTNTTFFFTEESLSSEEAKYTNVPGQSRVSRLHPPHSQLDGTHLWKMSQRPSNSDFATSSPHKLSKHKDRSALLSSLSDLGKSHQLRRLSEPLQNVHHEGSVFCVTAVRVVNISRGRRDSLRFYSWYLQFNRDVLVEGDCFRPQPPNNGSVPRPPRPRLAGPESRRGQNPGAPTQRPLSRREARPLAAGPWRTARDEPGFQDLPAAARECGSGGRGRGVLTRLGLCFLPRAFSDHAHFDVCVIQSEKKPFTSPSLFLHEAKKQVKKHSVQGSEGGNKETEDKKVNKSKDEDFCWPLWVHSPVGTQAEAHSKSSEVEPGRCPSYGTEIRRGLALELLLSVEMFTAGETGGAEGIAVENHSGNVQGSSLSKEKKKCRPTVVVLVMEKHTQASIIMIPGDVSCNDISSTSLHLLAVLALKSGCAQAPVGTEDISDAGTLLV
ncbi:hypothetical protein E5288_WYG011023 [Bos mutus]|uniref:Uncharacterized protein n=1 Tax=Bos mutus TaxID=72004 RepID=A0A6B0R4H5_9CETA|nr:hypothetical protein [Bos mutus]